MDVKKKILLVEDEVIIAMNEAKLLEHRGYEVVTAADGFKALEALRANREIDLVLMDIDLGQGMDGTETAAAILEERDIPVLFLSSHTEPELVELTEKITSYGYVVKSGGITVLDASIKMAFKLFDAHRRIEQQNLELVAANVEMTAAVEELGATNEELLRWQKDLEHSEARFRALIEHSADAISLIDANGSVLYESPSYQKIMGYSSEERLGRNTFELVHPDDREALVLLFPDLLKNPRVVSFPPTRVRHADGSWRWIEGVGNNLLAEPGVKAIVINFRDITERKDDEENLQLGYRRLMRAETVSNSGNWEFHLDTKKVYASAGARRIYGLGDAEWDIAQVQAIPLTDFRPLLDGALNGLLHEGRGYDVEFRIRHNVTGEIRDVHSVAEYDPERNVVFGVIQDITDRKQAELNAKEVQERLRLLSDNLTGGMVYQIDTGADGSLRRFTYISSSVEQLHEVSVTEAMADAMAIYGQIFEKDITIIAEKEARAIESMTSFSAEIHFRLPSGRERWGLFISTPRRLADNHLVWDGIEMDITERIAMEFRLKAALKEKEESEEKFRSITEQTGDLVSLTDRNGTIIYASPLSRELFGCEPEEMHGRHFAEFLDSSSIPVAVDAFMALLERGERTNHLELTMKRKDGSLFFGELSGSEFQSGGERVILVVIRDITERIKAAEELKKTTALLNQAFAQSPVPMALVSMPDAVMRIINPACLEFLGIQDEPSYVGMPLFEFNPTFTDYDAQGSPGMAADLPLARALRGEPTYEEERRIVRKDGSERWELVTAVPIRDEGGAVIAGHIIMMDITERKYAERLIETERNLGMALSGASSLAEALRYSLTAAMTLGEMDSGGVYLVDDRCGLNLEVYEGLSKGYVDIVSYYGPNDPRTHIVLRGVPIYVDREGVKGLDDNAAIAAALQALIKREDLQSLAMIPICMMSEVLACMNVASHSRSTIQGRTRLALESIGSHMASAILRLRAQEGLLERERRFRNYFDLPLVGAAITSPDKGWVEVNDRACAMLGYSREELARLTWAELTYPDDLAADVSQFEQVVAGKMDSYSLDKRFIRKDGSVVWTSLSVGCVRNGDGSVNYMIALMDDITERKRIQGELIEAKQRADSMREKAEKLSRDKELLLREVHHRIKNNMSTMASLLDLQAAETSDSSVAAALSDAKGRLMSMGVLYNKLYRGDLHEDVAMGDYLPSLVEEITNNFPGTVATDCRSEDFMLDAKRVFPLGIILYELITNAMKYAFPGKDDKRRRKNMITIDASVKQGRVLLSVQDNGIGIPDTVDIDRSPGFGLQLVSMLAKQLGGTIRIDRGSGTRFILEFDA